MEIKNEIDGYTFTWTDCSIKVNRLNAHKDGRLTGELAISKDDKILMPASQFNFNAERTRTSLIKNLSEKFPKIGWNTIIDELAYHVQELARAGEPVQILWTNKDVKPPEYLIEPFIFKSLPNVIYGEKGVNKSTLAIVLYTCLILPWDDNELGLNVPNRSVKTLILDWETEGDITQYYAHRLQNGMNLPPFEIFYRRCALPLADDVEQIQGHISKLGSEVLIIDSLGAAAGGDLKTPEIALNFFTALRRLKQTSLIIAQTSKGEDDKKKRIFGSHFFEYYSRNIWEIVKSPVSSDNENDIALFHRSPNLTGILKPLGFHFHYNDYGMTIERTPVNLLEFMEKVDVQGKILDFLKGGSKHPKEISEAVHSTEGSVRAILTKLGKRGKVLKLGSGEWGLITNSELTA